MNQAVGRAEQRVECLSRVCLQTILNCSNLHLAKKNHPCHQMGPEFHRNQLLFHETAKGNKQV